MWGATFWPLLHRCPREEIEAWDKYQTLLNSTSSNTKPSLEWDYEPIQCCWPWYYNWHVCIQLTHISLYWLFANSVVDACLWVLAVALYYIFLLRAFLEQFKISEEPIYTRLHSTSARFTLRVYFVPILVPCYFHCLVIAIIYIYASFSNACKLQYSQWLCGTHKVNFMLTF